MDEANNYMGYDFTGVTFSSTTVDSRPVKLRWYYEMYKLPKLQYAYIVTSNSGQTIEWADIPVEYEPGYVGG